MNAIGYLNVHGTGTRRNDDLEMEWIHHIDRERRSPLPFGSTKAVTGHCLGATPVLEAIICLEALKRRCLPLSAHCRHPHPDAPAGLVLKAGQPLAQQTVMSHSLGFWGGASSLIFRSLDA
jgi:3-oxoacyl-[acyl-carrier-protein] synthase II